MSGGRASFVRVHNMTQDDFQGDLMYFLPCVTEEFGGV